MQPFSLAEMRESLRREGLQALKARGFSSRLSVLPCPAEGSASTTSEVASLRRQLRELEDERSAFLQEGVFDLVKFLCSTDAKTTGARESHVTLSVEGSENAKLRKALETVSACADMDEVRQVVQTVLDDITSRTN